MNTIHILIIFMTGYGGSIDHIEFLSKERCDSAKQALRTVDERGQRDLKMICVPKATQVSSN